MPGIRRRARGGRGAQDPQSHPVLLLAVRGGLEPTLDKLVEVTFTVNQSVRRIAAHDPDSSSLRRIYAPDLLEIEQ